MASPTPPRLRKPGQTAMARTARPKPIRRPAGHSRSLCPACAQAVHDRLLLDSAGRLSAIADPRLLLGASEETRTAALAALVADRSLWPALLAHLFAQPALHRLTLERLRYELLELAGARRPAQPESTTFG